MARDIVRESENVSCQKSKEGSETKVAGQNMENRDEMLLGVAEKGQTGDWSPNKQWTRSKKGESTQEFQSNRDKSTWIANAINFELPSVWDILPISVGKPGRRQN